jgi:hypothetical protein
MFGILVTVVHCVCNRNSYYRRTRKLREREMEAEIRAMENARPGTVFPVYQYAGGPTGMMGNSQLMMSPNMPMQQQMSAFPNPMMTGMSPAYNAAFYPPVEPSHM